MKLNSCQISFKWLKECKNSNKPISSLYINVIEPGDADQNSVEAKSEPNKRSVYKDGHITQEFAYATITMYDLMDVNESVVIESSKVIIEIYTQLTDEVKQYLEEKYGKDGVYGDMKKTDLEEISIKRPQLFYDKNALEVINLNGQLFEGGKLSELKQQFSFEVKCKYMTYENTFKFAAIISVDGFNSYPIYFEKSCTDEAQPKGPGFQSFQNEDISLEDANYDYNIWGDHTDSNGNQIMVDVEPEIESTTPIFKIDKNRERNITVKKFVI